MTAELQPSPPRQSKASRTALLALIARHQTGSIIATLVDFSIMIALVSAAGLPPVAATAIGAACGGATNFSLGRRWIFKASAGRSWSQAVRYLLVSTTSLALNSLGEWIAHDLLGGQYIVARAVVAFVVSLAWNFPMQRYFVFGKAAQDRERGASKVGIDPRNTLIDRRPEDNVVEVEKQ